MPFWLLRPIAWLLFHIAYLLFGGIRVEGREHVPRKGGVLIAPNHISDADPSAVALALPRACWFMAKAEIFAMKFIGPLVRQLHGFPVKRYTADRSALRRAEELLEQGEAVVIFPEGQVSHDGQLQDMLPGALLVARAADAPVVPTAILGTDALLPYGKVWPRPAGRRIIVRFGPPVSIAQLTGGIKGGNGLKIGADRLKAMIQALQQGQPYPEFTEEETVTATVTEDNAAPTGSRDTTIAHESADADKCRVA
jgi:1-acyl-sn-glycerol-3-phosphate acyltransferase